MHASDTVDVMQLPPVQDFRDVHAEVEENIQKPGITQYCNALKTIYS